MQIKTESKELINVFLLMKQPSVSTYYFSLSKQSGAVLLPVVEYLHRYLSTEFEYLF